MELLKKLRSTPVPKITPPEEHIKYLEQTNLLNVVNKGLAELYRIQPQNPITFLSDFLFNESYSTKIVSGIEEEKKASEIASVRTKKLEEEAQKIKVETETQEASINEQKEKLRGTITTCEDFETSLNDICEQLKNIVHATGVYVSVYDLKRKPVESIDEDENAHIDPDNVKVLRFVNYCKDHEFLHGKFIKPGKGVTYQLFLSGEELQDPEAEEGEGGEAAEEKKEEGEGEEGEENEQDDEKNKDTIKNICINDAVTNNRIVFFREPRLGCYSAYNITYQSSLNYKSLLSAVENLNEYNKLKEEEEERLKEAEANKEGEEQEQAVSGEDEEDNNNSGEAGEGEEGGNNEGEEGETEEKPKKIELQDFEKEEKIIILSLDTLGQDRTFNDNEKEFINEIAKLLRDSMQNLEKRLLEKDRDSRMEYLKLEKALAEEWNQDKIYAEKENAARDYLSSDEFLSKNITDEAMKGVEESYGKANSVIQTILNNDFITVLQMFEKFEFVEYEKVFQNIFYFARIDPKEINEPETNKLSWKLARKKWNELFDILKEYNPLGPKPGQILSVFKGNVILENLSEYTTEEKTEEISQYCFSLTRLIDYVVSILKVRKTDIMVRHTDQKMKIKERLDIIKQNEQLEKDRKKALAKAKAEFYGKEYKDEEEEKEEDEENPTNKQNEGGDEAGEDEENEEGDVTDEKKDETEEKKEEVNPDAPQFNETEWLSLYDQEHPKTPVPDEITVDVDDDFDIDEEGGAEEEEEGDDAEGKNTGNQEGAA